MYKCKHFSIQELVPTQVYADRGELAWELLDERALKVLDQLRDKWGTITVNNAYKGGDRNWSGLRTPESPYGAKYSQHRYGRAFDCIFSNITAEEVRTYIMANPNEFPLIGSMEEGTSWLHFDVRNCDRIKLYPAA